MDEAAGIIMGEEEWMKDAAWLIIFPLSLSETVVHGPKTQLEGKNLRTSQCATELEFSKRFYCRCKCEG